MLIYPNAKINLGLYVTERRADGYHNLETVFLPIPLHDVIEINAAPREVVPLHFRSEGLAVNCEQGGNLIERVCLALSEEFQLPPLDVSLSKRIPMGAGLGGGSSDAAFTLCALNELFALELSAGEMERRLAAFGADCPFFVRNEPAYATGIGDVLTPYALSLKGYVLALVKPATFVSTREAYAGIRPKPAPVDLREALARPVATWRECVTNDFEESVFAAHPDIAAIKATLYDMGAIYAAMSGSGSTVFALFSHRVEELPRVFPNCFVHQALLRK